MSSEPEPLTVAADVTITGKVVLVLPGNDYCQVKLTSIHATGRPAEGKEPAIAERTQESVLTFNVNQLTVISLPKAVGK